MDFALVYILRRAAFRFIDFFHHWYMDGSRRFLTRFLEVLNNIERGLALRLTLRHFFEPLYRDYTIVGRILGVIFRSGRLLLGGIAYVATVVCFIIAYFIWIIVPPATLIYSAIELFHPGFLSITPKTQ